MAAGLPKLRSSAKSKSSAEAACITVVKPVIPVGMWLEYHSVEHTLVKIRLSGFSIWSDSQFDRDDR